MFYSIRHLTRFRYTSPVSESLMEVRMHPRTEAEQRCLSFQLFVDPKTRIHMYRDYLGNSIHHFNVPAKHLLSCGLWPKPCGNRAAALNPPPALTPESWDALDA